MRFVRWLCVLLGMAVVVAPGSAIAGYAESRAWFEALAPLDRDIVQTNLVLIGKYDGLIDGNFGQGTYAALLAFQAANAGDGSGVPSKAELDKLASAARAIFGELGIDKVQDAGGGLSLYLPKSLLTQTRPTHLGVSYTTRDGEFELQTVRVPSSEQSYDDLYRSLSTEGPNRKVVYSNRGLSGFTVTGKLDGRYFYTRFYKDGSQSVGFSLTWDAKYRQVGSMLSIFLASFSNPASQEPAPGNDAAQKRGIGDSPQSQGPRPQLSAGSGFFFGDEGMIATNYHVAGTCRSITVVGYGSAKLVHGDKDLDIAAIQLDSHRSGPVAMISTKPPELAQGVILLGYPLSDLLNASLNVSTGIVSTENGSGDPNWFTTNAGIEPGNSGGPILDEYGNVLGIAVAKLDDVKLLQSAGTTAPNVGFAIKDTTLLNFLRIFNHKEAPISTGAPPSLQDTVRAAKNFTVQIVCDAGAPEAVADTKGVGAPSAATVESSPSLPNDGKLKQ